MGRTDRRHGRELEAADLVRSYWASGEFVYFKLPLKGPEHDENGNMAARHAEGVFLGYSRDSNTYRLSKLNGEVVESGSITRKPMETRWDGDALEKVVSTPWSLRESAEAVKVDFGAEVPKHPAPEEAEPPLPRRVKITMNTLREFGFTANCRACDHMSAFGEAKNGLAHSEACRARIVEAMARTTHGAARIRSNEERINRSLSQRVEFADRRKAEANGGGRAEQAGPAPRADDQARPPRAEENSDQLPAAAGPWWAEERQPEVSRFVSPRDGAIPHERAPNGATRIWTWAFSMILTACGSSGSWATSRANIDANSGPHQGAASQRYSPHRGSPSSWRRCRITSSSRAWRWT